MPLLSLPNDASIITRAESLTLSTSAAQPGKTSIICRVQGWDPTPNLNPKQPPPPPKWADTLPSLLTINCKVVSLMSSTQLEHNMFRPMLWMTLQHHPSRTTWSHQSIPHIPCPCDVHHTQPLLQPRSPTWAAQITTSTAIQATLPPTLRKTVSHPSLLVSVFAGPSRQLHTVAPCPRRQVLQRVPPAVTSSRHM